MNHSFKAALTVLPLIVLAACSSTQTSTVQHQSDSRYSMSQDTGPLGDYDISDLKNAVPTAEPYSRGGNRSPYTVWGKSYHVMESGDGYQASGIASWYGAKFHGHKTSNGETYDMYEMSAAHRNLPLPSFVEVTNLANNRKVIVRVNDRGPFHSERIIDLSYAAAKKLGFSDKGTARVHVAAITVRPDGTWVAAGRDKAGAVAATSPTATVGKAPAIRSANSSEKEAATAYVQVGAFRDAGSAAAFQAQVRSMTDVPVTVVAPVNAVDGWHRVQIGPFGSRAAAETERDRIHGRRLGQPVVVMQAIVVMRDSAIDGAIGGAM